VPTNANIKNRDRAATNELNRVLIFAPDALVMKWVEDELAGLSFTLQVARSAREIVRALIDDPPPRAQVLTADLDAMSASDVLGLHGIRDRGWFGSVIALGTVSKDLCASLNIEHVIARPLVEGALRRTIAGVGLDRATTRIPKVK
jgi:hypothetical protein